MVARSTGARRRTVPAKAAPAPAPARKVARKAAPAPVAKRAADVTVYADKEATDYHKAFARWIVKEVGFNPDEANSKRVAFLRGVSIATAARPAFMDSDFLAEWRESTGTAKRGPKTRDEVEEAPAPVARRRKAAPVVEEVEDDADEFDDDDSDADEFDDDSDDDTDEFDDDDDSDEEESDDDDFDDEEDAPVEEAPAPVARRGRPAKVAPAPAKAARRTPAKAAPVRGKAAKDDDFLF